MDQRLHVQRGIHRSIYASVSSRPDSIGILEIAAIVAARHNKTRFVSFRVEIRIHRFMSRGRSSVQPQRL